MEALCQNGPNSIQTTEDYLWINQNYQKSLKKNPFTWICSLQNERWSWCSGTTRSACHRTEGPPGVAAVIRKKQTNTHTSINTTLKHDLIYNNNNVCTLYLEKLVNLGQVNSLLGIQFVDVAAVSIHQVEAEPHDLFLKKDVHPSAAQPSTVFQASQRRSAPLRHLLWAACVSRWGWGTSCSRSSPRTGWRCPPAAPRSRWSPPAAAAETGRTWRIGSLTWRVLKSCWFPNLGISPSFIHRQQNRRTSLHGFGDNHDREAALTRHFQLLVKFLQLAGVLYVSLTFHSRLYTLKQAQINGRSTNIKPSVSRVRNDNVKWSRWTNLGDFVVVCQEHGQILRLLDGWRFRHFSEELGGSEDEKLIFSASSPTCSQVNVPQRKRQFKAKYVFFFTS